VLGLSDCQAAFPGSRFDSRGALQDSVSYGKRRCEVPGPPNPNEAGARYLFVYGTLRSVFHNPYARLLAQRAVLLGTARLPGRLYRLGSYPGMLAPHTPKDWVTGELYRLPSAFCALLWTLDQYEGPGFERVLTIAHRAGRPPVKTWVYLCRQRVSEAQRIVSGNYCK
jgi:gamma-glutamylcyclotransferase (GGCT)/AIG2-like uncharacterized protein YtfP